MQPRETPPSAIRRVVIISPSLPMADELEPLLEPLLAGAPINRLRNYPAPRDLGSALGGGTPQLVFLDVASNPEQALALLAEMARLGTSVQAIALLSGNDPDFILRCLRAGAVDFLIQPFTADQTQAAQAKLARQQPGVEGAGKEAAKIYAVMPAQGACGATTVACHLAFQWKRMGTQKVLLADLDPLAGTLSFLLKIKSVHSFLDTLQRSHEMDSDLWNATVTPVNGVDVLLAPELLVDGAQDLRDPSPILDYARRIYDKVVIDAGSVYGEWNLNQARTANELLLVTTNELPALQAAQRALSYLETNRIGRSKIRLIVNRYHRDVGLSREVIGTALHTDVFEILPSDYESVQKSLLEGRPVASNTAFGKGIVQLAERLGGGPASTVKKSSSPGGLRGLFTKTSK